MCVCVSSLAAAVPDSAAASRAPPASLLPDRAIKHEQAAKGGDPLRAGGQVSLATLVCAGTTPPPPPPLQAPAHSSQGSSRASVNGELLLLLAACTSVCLQKQSRAVRLNTVAILREGARVQREEEVETQRLVGLEAGQTDGSDYLKWQEEVKQVSPAP